MKGNSCLANYSYYGFLVQQEDRSFIIDYLSRVQTPPWTGMTLGDLNRTHEKIRRALTQAPDIDRLLTLHLAAHRFNEGDALSEELREFIDTHVEYETLFPGIDRALLLGGRWAAVAVPVVSSGKARLRWFMVGRLEVPQLPGLWPAWSTPLLDENSRTTAQNAASAALRHAKNGTKESLYLFPLALANSECQISGSSLGLPLALGFMSLLAGDSLPQRLLATGSIDPDGTIRRVGGLLEKRTAASSGFDGFSLLLCPSENESLPPDERMETLSVSDLDQAFALARCYRPGNADQLSTLRLMDEKPNDFIRHMSDVPEPWLTLLTTKGRLTAVLKEIATSPNLFARFAANLQALSDGWQLSRGAYLAELLHNDVTAHTTASYPVLAFRYRTVCLALANHRGDLDAADQAIRYADRLFGDAMQGDLEVCADYLNLRLVDRHNRFRFEPELDRQSLNFLKVLEARHESQCKFGCPTEPVLARLYGTIAQNFAFCGPDWLNEAKRYAQKSIQAFGDDEVAEYRPDILRQHGYLAYANLDAGRIENAQDHLFQFVEATDWDAVRSRWMEKLLSQWQHTLLARFLADTSSEKSAAYLDWCTEHPEAISTEGHPYQLWTYNLGRIALALKRPDKAADWFRKSLSFCTSQSSRQTIFAMALLPMAELMKAGLLEKTCGMGQINAVTNTAHGLNPIHFKSSANEDHALPLVEAVAKNPARYFPFSYR